tara:strand:- start:181 stop:855 length:675 start_codon:yes stop_codon:yes gene_type:complete
MKKIIFKYVIEFSVIVLGISVSFWFDKYQTSLDNIDREKEVLTELSTELEVIENTIKNRDSVFRFDKENLVRIIDDKVANISFTYNDLLIASTDYRGFSPSEEIYTSLKYDGGLKFIRNSKIKVAIESFYNGTKYGVVANMEDEIVVQREILKYIQYNHPQIIIKISKMKISEFEKIKLFTNIVQKDSTLKSLLVSKLRFMNSKLIFLQRYKSSLSTLKNLITT